MSTLHKEINFETEICEYLASHGWHYSPDDSGYDRVLALYPADLEAWLQETQPKEWALLVKDHGAKVLQTVVERLRAQLNQRGTLDVIRHGMDFLGLRGKLKLAEFKPALRINADILARYTANRLRVVRQVHYSATCENSIDLVFFLNGLPVATVELKTDFTQSVQDAIDQYRFDRNPKPKARPIEPMLSFPSGALVHFAVSNDEAHMTTKLAGPATRFLPFNQGDAGGPGNPLNPTGGHRTSYLWEQVWARDSWLEILGRYMISVKDAKNVIKEIIFPRYHQLAATRKLLEAVRREGPGGKYLIQHSAGSGKTNSIAWSAHFLATLHDAKDKKVFEICLRVHPTRKSVDEPQTEWGTKGNDPLIHPHATSQEIEAFIERWFHAQQPEQSSPVDKKAMVLLAKVYVSKDLFNFDKKSGKHLGSIDMPDVETLLTNLQKTLPRGKSFAVENDIPKIKKKYYRTKDKSGPAAKILEKPSQRIIKSKKKSSSNKTAKKA